MKKISNLCLSFIMMISIISSTVEIHASTSTNGQSETDYNGITIIYDENTLNGSIDLETKLLNNTSIDKTNSKTPRSGSVEIYIPFQTQQTDYYCGPASARMVLGGIGYYRTQDQMASLLGTTVNGTNAGNGVANALNSVVAGSQYEFRWQWHTYTDISTIKGHIVEALNYGNPVMVNTMESPGDVYLAGHNIGTTLYHYGVVADYFNYGNEVTYTDPGYGRYSGFVQDQRVSITNLSYAVGGRGYAW